MESLSKRLIGSKGKLLVAQGDVPKGPYTIVYGTITHVDHPRTVEKWYPRIYRRSDHCIPSELRDIQFPTQPRVHCDPVPVNDKTSVQKLLKELEFEHYTGDYAFYSEPCKTVIFPIIHLGLPNFKQDYVARVYIEEGKKDILWPP